LGHLAAGGLVAGQPQAAIAQPTATAEPAPAAQPASGEDALADAEGQADPAVAALTQKIDAMAEGAAAEPAPAVTSTQPAVELAIHQQPVPSATQPAVSASITPPPAAPIASAAPSGSPAPTPHTPTQSTPGTTLTNPLPVAQAHAQPAPVQPAIQPQPVSAATTQPAVPMVANAPTAVTEAQQARTEVAASPSPRPIPFIQPAAVDQPPPTPAPTITVSITDIRPVTVAAVTADATLATANQPAVTEPPAPTATLESVIAQIEQTLQQRPPHPEDELRLRLLYVAAGMEDKLSEPIRGMDPIQTELLDSIVKAVTTSRQAMLDPLNSGPSALAAADELRRLLGQQSGVSIPRIALVTKVSSYGDYDLISPARFKAGNEIHAYVYTEVANYRSEPTNDDRLRTLLGERVQVFDAAGTIVWERNEPNIEDRVRSPRRDFFIPFPMRLPATLPPGEYVVKVTIEDRIGGTTDQQRLTFTIE